MRVLRTEYRSSVLCYFNSAVHPTRTIGGRYQMQFARGPTPKAGTKTSTLCTVQCEFNIDLQELKAFLFSLLLLASPSLLWQSSSVHKGLSALTSGILQPYSYKLLIQIFCWYCAGLYICMRGSFAGFRRLDEVGPQTG